MSVCVASLLYFVTSLFMFCHLFACNIQSKVAEGLGQCQSGFNPGECYTSQIWPGLRSGKKDSMDFLSSSVYTQEQAFFSPWTFITFCIRFILFFHHSPLLMQCEHLLLCKPAGRFRGEAAECTATSSISVFHIPGISW